MFQDSWGLYEAPYPKRWIFHPRRRPVIPHLLTILAAVFAIFEVVSRL